MVSLLRILLLSATIEASIGEETVVEMGFVKFFDSFDDEVPDMAYTGGYILIECRVNECQTYKHKLELRYREMGRYSGDGEVADSAECGKGVVFRLEITEDFKFGYYTCKRGEHSSNRVYLNYRFCSALDSICAETCHKRGSEYCVKREYDSNPCVTEGHDFHKLSCTSVYEEETNALYAGIKYCGASTLGRQPRTLCEALAEEKLHKIKARVLDPDVTEECLLKGSNVTTEDKYGTDLPYPEMKVFEYPDGFKMRYNDIISVRADTIVEYEFPAHYLNETMDVRMNCTLKTRNGTILDSRSLDISETGRWYSNSTFFESALFGDKGRVGDHKAVVVLDIFKFQCFFIKSGSILLADTSFYVYPTGGVGAVVTPIRTADERIEKLQCDQAYDLPARFVIKRYEWSGAYVEQNLENETSHELIPTATGYYYCKIIVQMRCNKGKDLVLQSTDFKIDKIPDAAVGKGPDGGKNGCREVAAVGPFGHAFSLIGFAIKLHGI